VIRTLTANDTENDVPEKTQNKAITQVLIRDQETIVIGGLRTDNYLDTKSKMPILGDIPVLGRAFRTTGKDHQHKELLIFITPTLITELSQPESTRLAELDESLAKTMRIDDKPDLQRGLDSVVDHENELMVSIGQKGGVFVDGAVSTMPALRERLANDPGHAETVVIRSHPRAPSFVATNVAELAMEAGMKVKYEDRFLPFAPSLPKE
jgi:Bacterial type II and III secretion system protein